MMTHEERLEVYREATKLWGLVAQYDQCVEEMGELIVAINKFKRKVLCNEKFSDDKKIIDNLIEEIADVTICLEQMQDFYKDYGIDQVIEKKMQKFKGQIEQMKKDKE